MSARVIPFPQCQATRFTDMAEAATSYLESGPLLWSLPANVGELRYTPGIRRLIEGPQRAAWVVEIIGRSQREHAPDQRWNLNTRRDRTGELSCEIHDGRGALHVIGPRRYRRTGFPPGCVTFWCVRYGDLRVLMMATECGS
jgi:hypothetical protein